MLNFLLPKSMVPISLIFNKHFFAYKTDFVTSDLKTTTASHTFSGLPANH